MNLAWKLRKAAISAFILVHISATLIWVLPDCPIRTATIAASRYYMLPLGLWQYWGMFAPDPIRQTLTLEAEVVDAQGLRHHFDFPRAGGSSLVEGFLRARHPKFASNLAEADLETTRGLTARYAVRKLDLSARAFPLDAYLVHKVKPSPALGDAVDDQFVDSRQVVISVSHFESLEELNR